MFIAFMQSFIHGFWEQHNIKFHPGSGEYWKPGWASWGWINPDLQLWIKALESFSGFDIYRLKIGVDKEPK